jgi:hypothetical protein
MNLHSLKEAVRTTQELSWAGVNSEQDYLKENKAFLE